MFVIVLIGVVDIIKVRFIIIVWFNQYIIRFVYIGIDIYYFVVKFDFRVGGIQCCLLGISKLLFQGYKDFVDFFIVVRLVRCGIVCVIVIVVVVISILVW